MTMKPLLKQWLGTILFLIGTGIGLTLAGFMTWGELEANLDINIPDARELELSCPLMLASNETGTVQAVIVNETEKEIQPVIKAGFGHRNSLTQKQVDETHILGPKETQTLQWSVDSSQSAYGYILPVSIIQSRYSRNPPRWGACGILLFSLFGLNGATSLTLIVSASILLLAAGIYLTSTALNAQGDVGKSLRQAGGVLAGLTLLAIISSLFRWWGLTILIETISLIALGTFVIDSVFGQQKMM